MESFYSIALKYKKRESYNILICMKDISQVETILERMIIVNHIIVTHFAEAFIVVIVRLFFLWYCEKKKKDNRNEIRYYI